MCMYHGDRTIAIVRRKKQHYLPLNRKLKLKGGANLMGNTHSYILILNLTLTKMEMGIPCCTRPWYFTKCLTI